MVTSVKGFVDFISEELVEGWSSWAYKIMCTEPGLECGVFNKEHRRQKFAVD